MLVILRKSIENLGRMGDIVKVSDGYARNYLLPRNWVVAADEKNKAAVEHHRKMLEKKRLAEMATAQEQAKKLESFSCTLSRKVGEHEKLFGSVSTGDIADALKAAGFSVEKKWIDLPAPIKTLGVHPVSIRLNPDVTTTVKVWVVKEE